MLVIIEAFKAALKGLNTEPSVKERRAPNGKPKAPQTANRKLRQLREMQEEGLITEEECLAKRRKILDSI